jgi:hypothetical protein
MGKGKSSWFPRAPVHGRHNNRPLYLIYDNPFLGIFFRRLIKILLGSP